MSEEMWLTMPGHRSRRGDARCIYPQNRTDSRRVNPYPSAYGALPPGPPAKGEALCNLSIGFVLRGGPTATPKRPCRPSPENKPINGFQGPLPLAEVQEAEPPGRGPGRKPRSFTGTSDCPHDRLAMVDDISAEGYIARLPLLRGFSAEER